MPIALPPGRNGFQPQLALTYSSGAGNGPFGLGWTLGAPAISRKTSQGVPRYDDALDTFLLSGAEDLVPVTGAPAGATRYRPRTEGLFSLVDHHRGGSDHWEVRAKDGTTSIYGTPRPQGAAAGWTDPAALEHPAHPERIFSWHLSETRDTFGNRIQYGYRRDRASDGPHAWNQLYLRELRYVDYGQAPNERFLVTVGLVYDDDPDPLDGSLQNERPDPFSQYRSRFEVRTRRRCTYVVVATHAGSERRTRAYRLVYLDERDDLADLSDRLPANGVSLLSRVELIGFDDSGTPQRELPPLELGYTEFRPRRRRFIPLSGRDLPSTSLADPALELIDLSGDGLADLVQSNGSMRIWRNRGDGHFDEPREMAAAPSAAQLADPGVQLLDANGDGRADLLLASETAAGYFSVGTDAAFDRRSFRPYSSAPSFRLEDPEVRLVDLDGDGVTDALRSGTRLECFFNEAERGWTAANVRQVERRSLERFPDVDLADPRVKLADMTGDGQADVVLVYDANVEYWPSLGRGDWGERIHMRSSPRLPYGYDPRRVLVGDVDGDGLADLVYVADRRVVVWINRAGNGFSDPIEVAGTPPVSDVDSVRLADVLGTGVAGILWSSEPRGQPRETLFFLDLLGGVKPYLLDQIDNGVGLRTRVGYAPSTRFYLDDRRRRSTRWRSSLPFPVHVVERVEVLDAVSRGKLTSRFSYHHGHWDGFEREFRGFGRVDRVDSEEIGAYNAPGLNGDADFTTFDGDRARHFSPPTLLKTWFHQGPVADASGGWRESDLSDEHWPGDRSSLEPPAQTKQLLASLPRSGRRDALRALRGSTLRTELFALDGTSRAAAPYTVTERAFGVREEEPPPAGPAPRARIFFPHQVAERTTQWERGVDPLTRVEFSEGYDAFGQSSQRTTVALPRRSTRRRPGGAAAGGDETRVLATHTRSEHAAPDPGLHLHDRVAHERTFSLAAPPGVSESKPADPARVVADGLAAAAAAKDSLRVPLDAWSPGDPLPAGLELIGHVVTRYDGGPAQAFLGRPPGELGPYGAAVRTESLAFTSERLDGAWGAARPAYLGGGGQLPSGAPSGFGTQVGYRLRQRSSAGYHDGYYIELESQKLDFQDSGAGEVRGRVLATRHALGEEFSFDWDQYGLFRTSFEDPAGLTTTATHDYRALQPKLVTDPNGNRVAFEYTPLGLLAATALEGKAGAGEGDATRAGSELSYDFRSVPISVRARRYVHHDSEAGLSAAERADAVERVEYSDGLGRLVQTRSLADDVLFDAPGQAPLFGDAGLPADQTAAVGSAVGRRRASGDPPNVVVSGWRTYDNKGRVVEAYEPFFSAGFGYAAASEEQLGAKTTFVYDPRGTPLLRENPDGSQQRTVVGVPSDLSQPEQVDPSPWELTVYDPNDNAGRTPLADARAGDYERHWDTPTTLSVDALGRTVSVLERTRAPGTPPGPVEELRTSSTFDLRGNLLSVTDPLGRTALERVYDLLGRTLRSTTLDGGTRTYVPDAVGNVVEARDARGGVVLRRFDALNRISGLWARDDASSPLGLRERFEYGDGGSAGQAPAQRAAARALNALGQLRRSWDQAGLVRFEAYDFKGNLVRKVRQVVADAELLAGFGPPAPPGWQVPPYRLDWDAAGASVLDAEEFECTFAYDALNRLTSVGYPLDLAAQGDPALRRNLELSRDRAGLLTRVDLGGSTFVDRIAYNARGRRVLLVHGGQALMTRYAYEPAGNRLARLRTEGCAASAAGRTLTPAGSVVQDLGYRYDLAGNLVSLSDRAPAAGVPGTGSGADALDRSFTYDPLYRLASADGRESTSAPSGWPSDRRGDDPAATRTYGETYSYDDAGNLTELRHDPAATGYRRSFALSAGGNRLASVTDAGATRAYAYDANGNLAKEGSDRHLEWDHADRLRTFRVQNGTSVPATYAHHCYDSTGRLVKKLARSANGDWESAVYIDDLLERRRRVQGAAVTEHDLLHVMDTRRRIGTNRVGPELDGGTAAPVVLNLADHLESSTALLEPSGALVGREEYLPYGETSFGGLERSRYRFTGQERHDESGLSYHANRWYAPWLGRWLSCDPLPPARPGLGCNQYAYVRDNPLSFVDHAGLQEDEPLPEGVIPLDGTPIRRAPEPQFPKWFTEDQKKAYRDKWRTIGAFRSWANRDPDTGRPIPPRDPYTKYEKRIFAIGDFCRTAILVVATLPAFWEWVIFEPAAPAAMQAEMGTALSSIKAVSPAVEREFAVGTASPELAQTLEGLQAQGVRLRGNFIHVGEDSQLIGAVRNHGGAYHELGGQFQGNTFVNMRELNEAIAAGRTTPLTTPQQVLQHEMGHFGQSVIPNQLPVDPRYYIREAQASATAATRATSAVDQAALNAHAQANIDAARGIVNSWRQP